ncbi:MAG: DNA polymerase III subunit delta [Roseburia sp.]|nr:DNA polymerase III subunit delta [Roseburia sp.]
MALPSFRDIVLDIRKGNIAPVYILMGEEDYYIDCLMNELEKNVVDENDKDFNLTIYFGSESDMESVVASCQQLPVMAPRHLVMLKEAQSKQQSKMQLEKLAPYCEHPNPSAVLAIAFKGDNLNATSKLIKNATKSGAVIFKSEKVKDYQLPTKVKEYCSSQKVGIEDMAIELLCQYIGSPLSKLFGEINKLILIKGSQSARITVEDVENHIGISKDFNNFELVSAISRKDYPKAIQIIKYFENNPKTNPTVITTSTIYNFFTKLVIAHYLPEKSDNSIKAATGARFPNQLNEIKEGMRNYNPYRAVYAIHALRDFDVESKGVGSFQNEYKLLTELIFKIFTL